MGDGLDLFLPILIYTTSLLFRGLRDISVVSVFSARESTYSILSTLIWACWNTQSELSYQTGPISFTRHLLKISLNQRKMLSLHSSTLPKTAITYFALVLSLTARSNESFTASSNGWYFGGGNAAEVLHLCDCNRR